MNGKSLDPLGLSHQAVQSWKNKFTTNFNRFKISIDRHFDKISVPKNGKPPLDKVVIDLKYMDEVNPMLKQQVVDYIQTNYPQYNNDTFLIKLNL